MNLEWLKLPEWANNLGWLKDIEFPLTFMWPMMLLALLIVPLLVFAYMRLVRRQLRAAAQYPAWSGAAGAANRGKRIHLPAILVLVAVIALIGALARPHAVLSLPSERGVIILAMDVSNSMKAADMEPSRLATSQKAAREFIDRQPRTTRIGIVAFANSALLVQRPTTNREELHQAVDRLRLGEGTGIGSAIITSLWALFPNEEIKMPGNEGGRGGPGGGPSGMGAPGGMGGSGGQFGAPLDQQKPAAEPKPKPPADNTAVVLLTDGESNARPDPIEAAKVAGERGVRVFTVGMGTLEGFVMKERGQSIRVRLDEEVLKQIAEETNGRYFQAKSAEDLREIYKMINSRIQIETKQQEISAFFVALAAVTGMLGVALSLLWFHRVV